MRNGFQWFWLRGVWSLATAALGLGLASPSLAQASREIQVHLQAGEAREVLVDLERDSRPELDFLARLSLPEGKAWRNGQLTLSLLSASDPSVTEQRVPHSPSGRQILLKIAARHCSPPGLYSARLEIAAIEKSSEHPAGTFQVIPLSIDVAADPICATTKAIAGGSAVLVAVLGLYARLMFLNSIFLSPSTLASRLLPLRWTEMGGVEGSGGHQEGLRGRIARQLSWERRIVAWLAANPLVFGLPGKRYEETVHIEVDRRPDHLFLTLVPERRSYEHFQAHPEDARGRLFARAERNGGVSFFGMPDSGGRIGRLLPARSLRSNQLSNLGDLQLVEPDPPEERAQRPAGWKILGLGGRS